MNSVLIPNLNNLDSFHCAMKDLEIVIDNLKKEESELAKKRKHFEAILSHGKEEIKRIMLEDGICEVTGEVVKYTLTRSNPKLVIEDEKLIPNDYKESIIETVIRKDAIKDQLKLGDIIPGCRLEESFALKVGLK